MIYKTEFYKTFDIFPKNKKAIMYRFELFDTKITLLKELLSYSISISPLVPLHTALGLESSENK